ncbi:MAG: hypothetical protein RSC29_04555 [Oscillospiraceae bacterium]
MMNRMNREEYEGFRDNVLKERFVCVKSFKMRNYLMDNAHRYLFECIDRKTKKRFWIFDKTDEVLYDICRFYEELKTEQESVQESGE